MYRVWLNAEMLLSYILLKTLILKGTVDGDIPGGSSVDINFLDICSVKILFLSTLILLLVQVRVPCRLLCCMQRQSI